MELTDNEQRHVRFQKQLAESIDYLESDAAQKSFEVDPYWPKWNSPWWHMTLLWELGASASIPASAVERLVHSLKNDYIQFFPFTASDLPEGIDPISDVMCHCGLGTAYQILKSAGVKVDEELPWVREWFTRYKMADGGWNCDEAAYTRTNPKSSIVSTLPILEALLSIHARTQEETDALDAGADYLLKRRLVRSLQTGEIINQDWLQLTFPRFYEYDLLRGLSFCVAWAAQRKKPLASAAIKEALELLESKLLAVNGVTGLPVERQFYKSCNSRFKDASGKWTKGPSTDFPLLRWASQVGQISPTLTFAWRNALATLARIEYQPS